MSGQIDRKPYPWSIEILRHPWKSLGFRCPGTGENLCHLPEAHFDDLPHPAAALIYKYHQDDRHKYLYINGPWFP